MTLLASERSMLIRSKFRSVLQLRMQHRRTQEQMSEHNLIPSPNKTQSPFQHQNGNVGQIKTEDILRFKNQNKLHKVSAAKMHFSEDSLVESDELKEKKARLAEDLNEKILHRPGPLELVKKNILPLATGIKDGLKDQMQMSSSSDTFSFEDDLSTSSSSSSTASSPRFAPSPGLSVNLSPTSPNTVFQLDLPQINKVNPTVGTVNESDSVANRPATHHPIQASAHVPKVSAKPSDMGKSQRQKKSKDAKPKVKKLKYHQYIPPDQKADRSPVAMDAAYSRLLQQQQIFLQLQILNQQQNQTFCVQTVHPLTTSISADRVISFGGTSGTPTINLSSTSGAATMTTANSTTISPLKPELLPANLDDLTVSELRQHLRKRGLPVSGTKPALLERLRPYQISRTKTIPAPIQSAGFLTPVIELPSFTNSSTCENTPAPLCTFRTLPSTASVEIRHESSDTSCSTSENSDIIGGTEDKDISMQGIDEDQVLIEKQKVIENLTWKLRQEQKQAEDLRVELEMHKRLKNRCKNEKYIPRSSIKIEVDDTALTSSCAKVQTEDTQYLYTFNNERQERQPPVQEPLSSSDANNSYMVFCTPSCDLIEQDFELPMQITASPGSPVQKPRSFEEELQEAIQKAQMALCQSIEDILEDEPLIRPDELMHVEPNIMENFKSDKEHQLAPSPASQNGNFSKPLPCCNDAPPQMPTLPNSGILEFPVPGHYDFLSGQDSLSVIFNSDQIEMPPSPQQGEDMSRSPNTSSRVPFDPAEWLEALTSGSTSNYGPSSPNGSSIFSTDIFDSPDLSINRMIDLMVEQW